MNATTANVTDTKFEPRVKVKANFDVTQLLTLDALLIVEKALRERKKELTKDVPKPTKDKAKAARTELATDALTALVGLNKAHELLKKWYDKDTKCFVVPNKGSKSLETLGIKDGVNFEHLLLKVSNFYVFFSLKKRIISPKEALDTIAMLTNLDDAKFSTLQRAGMDARKKK